MNETHRYSPHDPQTFLQYDILFLSILDLDVFLVNGATGTLDYYIVDYIISLWIIIHHCGLLLLWIIITAAARDGWVSVSHPEERRRRKVRVVYPWWSTNRLCFGPLHVSTYSVTVHVLGNLKLGNASPAVTWGDSLSPAHPPHV